MKILMVGIVLSLSPGVVFAGDLPVMVVDIVGRAVQGALVTFTPENGANISASDLKGPFVMAQRNVMFDPSILVVPVGATIKFPNFDRVQHHVYSFSKADPFQFPLYGKGSGPKLRFDHEGTVSLGCNIHDAMLAYIRVVATPYYAKTDDQGRADLKAPPGAGLLSVWTVENGKERQIDSKVFVGSHNDLQVVTMGAPLRR